MKHPGFRQQPGWHPPQNWQPPVQQRLGWQPSTPPRRRRSPLPFLGLAALALIVLLVYSFSSGETDEVATDYKNESYSVPSAGSDSSRIPVPQYESEIGDWLQANAVYAEQLAAPVRCDVDAIANPAALSDSALQTRMRGYVECLTRVWGPALETAGFEAYQPALYVYPAGGEVTTRCGTQESLNAFYCGADQNLYLAADVLRILPAQEASASGAFDLIIAHEYGHAMQGRSGVFAASHFLTEGAPSDAAAMEVSRMVELQADCFAGTAINSLAESLDLGDEGRESVTNISYAIGDDQLAARFNQSFEEGDHGVGENRALWAERGLTGGSLSTCNTFSAPGPELR